MIIKCIVFIIASIFKWFSPSESGKQTIVRVESDCDAPSRKTFFIYQDVMNGTLDLSTIQETLPAENRKTK